MSLGGGPLAPAAGPGLTSSHLGGCWLFWGEGCWRWSEKGCGGEEGMVRGKFGTEEAKRGEARRVRGKNRSHKEGNGEGEVVMADSWYGGTVLHSKLKAEARHEVTGGEGLLFVQPKDGHAQERQRRDSGTNVREQISQKQQCSERGMSPRASGPLTVAITRVPISQNKAGKKDSLRKLHGLGSGRSVSQRV